MTNNIRSSEKICISIYIRDTPVGRPARCPAGQAVSERKKEGEKEGG